MVRAVVDTNVLISSALKGGISRKIWTAFRDPCDNHILAAAYSARADFIVTGNKNLLCLNTFHKIKIVTPREFSLIASL